VIKNRLFEARDGAPIQRLNERLRRGGSAWEVYPAGEPSAPDQSLVARLFVAADDDEVRGAVWLHEQDFWLNGAVLRAGWAKYPVAESLVDPQYSGVPGAMLFRLMKEQPRLMTLGMGGHESPYARLLAGMGWKEGDIPFFVYLARPRRVLRHFEYIRRSRWKRFGADVLALTGLGSLGWQGHVLRQRLSGGGGWRSTAVTTTEVVPEFGPWADRIWMDVRDKYGFVGRRDAAALNFMYPRSMPVSRLLVKSDDRTRGWVTVAQHTFGANETSVFRNLTVGLIADGLSGLADVPHLVRAAVEHLVRGGADIIVSNQSHPDWIAALRRKGFLQVPSQMAFYSSPAMQRQLTSAADGTNQAPLMHVNRGDCDGPIFWGGARGDT
jgi:hypothetical protein